MSSRNKKTFIPIADPDAVPAAVPAEPAAPTVTVAMSPTAPPGMAAIADQSTVMVGGVDNPDIATAGSGAVSPEALGDDDFFYAFYHPKTGKYSMYNRALEGRDDFTKMRVRKNDVRRINWA